MAQTNDDDNRSLAQPAATQGTSEAAATAAAASDSAALGVLLDHPQALMKQFSERVLQYMQEDSMSEELSNESTLDALLSIR